MKVFLAAPMTHWLGTKRRSAEGLRSFVETLRETIIDNGHEVFSAHHFEYFGDRTRHETICTPFDYLEMRRSDLVIAFPATSGGVHTELGWASALKKPVFLLMSGRESPLARGLNTLTDTEVFHISTEFPEDATERARIQEALCLALARLPMAASRRREIAFISTAFGFGPSAKATALAQEFRQRIPNARLDFFGTGIDLDFAVCSEAFDQVVRMDVDDDDTVASLLAHIDRYDDVISVMNFLVTQKWRKTKARLHVVDSLAWMWPDVPPGIANADTYFIQRYLVSEERLEDWGRKLPVVPVGPICRRFPQVDECRDRERMALVNFSGCANPLIGPDVYRKYAVTLAKWIADEAGDAFDCIIISVQRHIAQVIKDEVTFQCPVRVGHLSPDDFGVCAQTATCILTTPGITTTLELHALGKRPSFLLPQNYSQALISERNLVLYSDYVSMAFSVFDSSYAVPPGLPEHEGVALVRDLLERALRDKEDLLRAKIRTMLARPSDCPPVHFENFGQDEIAAVLSNRAYQPGRVIT